MAATQFVWFVGFIGQEIIYCSPLAKAPENILPVIMGKHQNVIRMANCMKFHLVISYHIFFLAEMTHNELLAFFASGAKGEVVMVLYEIFKQKVG